MLCWGSPQLSSGVLQLLSPALGPGTRLRDVGSVTELPDTLGWQQLAQLVFGQMGHSPVPGGWLSVLAGQGGVWGWLCVTWVGLQEKVLWLCPTELKQPLCPSRASAAPRAAVSSEKY